MPKVPDSHREARRQQIMKAAYRCFGKKGFHRASMREICEEAGLSLGAVYNYFDSKEDLIRTVGNESSTNTRAYFREIASENEPLEALLIGLRDIVEQAEKDDLAAVRIEIRLWAESFDTEFLNHILRDNIESLTDIFTEFIQQAQAKGDADESIPASEAARVILAVYQGLVLQKAIDPDINMPIFLETFLQMLRKKVIRE